MSNRNTYSGHKRNRWENTKTSPNSLSSPPLSSSKNSSSSKNPSSATSDRNTNINTVSDDAAMEALLASVQTQNESPSKQQRSFSNRKSNYQRSNDNTNRKSGGGGYRESRGGGGGYYGPADNEHQSKQNDKQDSYENRHHRPRRRDETANESSYDWGGGRRDDETTEKEKENTNNDTTEKVPPQKPNFGLSGALAQDETTGNVYNGVVLKFTEPPEARVPNTRWRLYVFKPKPKDQTKEGDDGELLEIMHVSKQSAYLFGRDRNVADIPVDHPSLSKQHCVLQYRALPQKTNRVDDNGCLLLEKSDGGGAPILRCKPYLMDLESTNGTFINGERLDGARYYELRKGDVLRLGGSSREYVLLTENTTSA